jgi:hypothetical protein
MSKNSFFAPSILIFLSSIIYLLLFQDFAEKSFYYSYFLGIAGVIFCLKVYFIAFFEIDDYIKNRRHLLILIQLILFTFNISSIFLGIQNLHRETYPQITIQWFEVATLGFLLQAFLAKIPKVIIFSIVTVITYLIMFFVLRQKLFENNSQQFLLMQQTIATFAIILEAYWLILISRYFIKRQK